MILACSPVALILCSIVDLRRENVCMRGLIREDDEEGAAAPTLTYGKDEDAPSSLRRQARDAAVVDVEHGTTARVPMGSRPASRVHPSPPASSEPLWP